MKLNLFMFFFFFFLNNLERFSILFLYFTKKFINTHKVKLYAFFESPFLQDSPKNSRIPRNIHEKCVFQQSADVNFKIFPFGV